MSPTFNPSHIQSLFVLLLFLTNSPFQYLIIYFRTYYSVSDMNNSVTTGKFIGNVYSNNSSNVLMRVMNELTDRSRTFKG